MGEQIVDVIISGFGPTGAMAANLLGKAGITTAVIEREKEIYPLPRGIVIDDDVARVFQQADLKDEVLSVGFYSKGYNFLDQNGKSMFGFKRDFTKKEMGFASSIMIHQPSLEEILRQGLTRFPHVSVLTQHELQSITENENSVLAVVRDIEKNKKVRVKGKYLLVCEGGRSSTRKSLSIELEDYHFDHEWLVVDTEAIDDSLNLPDRNVQYCTPSRPTTYIYAGGNRYRWEFEIHPHEDINYLNTPEGIRGLLKEWIDPEKVTILRSAIYTFHALIAKRWRKGNVFLLGDTAHQMPPFLGQGLCSGLRDAHNLSWKLEMVLKGYAQKSLLESYETERKPHVEEIVLKAIQLGRVIQLGDQKIADLRDAFFEALNAFPNVNEALQGIIRSAFLLGEGIFDSTYLGKGRPFIQPTVNVNDLGGVLLDETLYYSRFVLIGIDKNPRKELDATSRHVFERLNGQFVHVVSKENNPPHGYDEKVTVIQDSQGRIEEWCNINECEFILLRPDRYVFGVYKASHLDRAIFELKDQINSTKETQHI